MAPESKISPPGPWIKIQNWKKSSAAKTAMTATLFDPPVEKGYAHLDPREVAFRHEFWITEDGKYRLYIFGDMSCLLVQQMGLFVRAHPVILRLGQSHNQTTLRFRRNQKYGTPQMWIKTPDMFLAQSYGTTIPFDASQPVFNAIRHELLTFLEKNPFAPVIQYPDWNTQTLYHWQRPRLSDEALLTLKAKINFVGTQLAKTLKCPIPSGLLFLGEVQNGRPSDPCFSLHTPTPWHHKMLSLLHSGAFGRPEALVCYQRQGKRAYSFQPSKLDESPFNGHETLSLVSHISDSI